MLYHFTSRPRWERIVEDGEIRALSPPHLGYEPKVVHLTLSASARNLPKSVSNLWRRTMRGIANLWQRRHTVGQFKYQLLIARLLLRPPNFPNPLRKSTN